jgi:hypothetical protein
MVSTETRNTGEKNSANLGLILGPQQTLGKKVWGNSYLNLSFFFQDLHGILFPAALGRLLHILLLHWPAPAGSQGD